MVFIYVFQWWFKARTSKYKEVQNLPKVIQSVSGKAQNWTQICLVPNHVLSWPLPCLTLYWHLPTSMHGATKTFRKARCVVEREPSEPENLASHADKVIYYLWTLSSLLINSVTSRASLLKREKSSLSGNVSEKTRHSVSRPSAWYRGPSVNESYWCHYCP